MRVSNWRKKIYASLATAGLLAPQAAFAVDIPLGDAGFEAFAVPSYGYAYSNIYRPTSAWIDDQDNPSEGWNQDDGDSNWLYSDVYGETTGPSIRPAPRSGVQAMHGLNNYSTQEVASVFEAGKTYTFSVYVQGDENPVFHDDHAWLYIFNGGQPFSEATSLKFSEFRSPRNEPFESNPPPPIGFLNRPVGATPALSKALWRQVSISHTVYNNAPEIGQPVGVGFFGRRDVAFDDAKLTIETQILTLEINTTNGHAQIVNQTGKPVNLDYYEITSAGTSLNPVSWNSLQEQNLAGFPAGNGSGNGWEQAGGASTTGIGESYLTGNSQIAASGIVGLGTAFAVGDPQDLVFKYGHLAQASLKSDFDQDGDVDGRDLLVWQRNFGTYGPSVTTAMGNANTDSIIDADDLAIWQAEYGNTSSTLLQSSLTLGYVRYVTSGFTTAVPEPTSVVLLGVGIAAAMLGRNRAS
jgi:hypothetical protein